jgi:hypothetical protein
MGAAVVAIPLAALVLPIVLILLAVLVDIAALLWALYRLWHDEWSVRVWSYARGHIVRPVKRLATGWRPAARPG